MSNSYNINQLIPQDELMHHGIKGQKWGKRKYQNKDGSLTPEGRARYGSKEAFEKVYPAEVNAKIKSTSKTMRNLSDSADELNKIETKRVSKKTKKINAAIDAQVKEHVSKMSDEELKAAVNRLNMEERYTQVMQNRNHIQAGESHVGKFLDGTATALVLASTGLSIALMIRELKK